MQDGDIPRGIRSWMTTFRGLMGAGAMLVVPPFQRAYSWGFQVEDLLHDTGESAEKNETFYFLGTLILQRDAHGELLVIDGHQRLMTLTLILAYLRDAVAHPALQAQLQAMIAPGGPGGQARLLVRRADQELVRDTVATPGRLAALAGEANLPSRSQRRIGEAAKLIIDRLNEQPPAALARFAEFLCGRITFNVIEADAGVPAASLFRVLGQRGMAMSESALIKSQLLVCSGAPREEADALSDRWDDLEERLGEAEFEAMLRLTPLVMTGDARLKEGDLGFFYDPHFTPERAGRFVREDLWTYARAFQDIALGDLDNAGGLEGEIRKAALSLQLYRERSWMAPAIAYLAAGRYDPPSLLMFLRGLDQLCFARTMGALQHPRMLQRFARAIAAQGDPDQLFGAKGELHLTPTERDRLIDKINEPIPTNEHRRRILALRMNAALPGGEVLLCGVKEATVEHVKPIADTTYWLSKFPPGREDLTHLLGNFVILTEKQNRDAADRDYDWKRRIYYETRRAPMRALTRHLEKYGEWNELQLRIRHEELIDTLWEDLGFRA
ncbi:MAG: DUF262 domain-containing protein [Hyphomonadaceae bacterium]